MPLPTDRTVFQNAWVVPDLEAAMRHWIAVMHVGPFFVLDCRDILEDILYRGTPSEMKMMVGLAQAGPVQIELIQPMMDGPNAYTDFVPRDRAGFHHVCTWTRDIDADIAHYAAHGCPTANSGRVKGGGRFAYFDTTAVMNCMVEVVEQSAFTEEFFGMIAASAANWDGKDPIRYL